MKRLVAMVVAAGAAVAAVAMPTKAELQKARAMVSDVTASDVAALKTKSKTPAEVAAKHMELAGEAENEAEKYVLLQGAFKLYAKAGDYEGAANALAKMNREIADMNPEVIVEIYNKAIFGSMKEKAPKLHAIKESARRQVSFRKQLTKAEFAAKANPKDTAAQKRLGECYAELDNWPKALDAFALAGGNLAKTAAAEKAGTAAPQVSGDFWWDYESGDEMSTYKLHAAELYRAALADDSFKGLARTRTEQRVKEADKVAPDLPRARKSDRVAKEDGEYIWFVPSSKADWSVSDTEPDKKWLGLGFHDVLQWKVVHGACRTDKENSTKWLRTKADWGFDPKMIEKAEIEYVVDGKATVWLNGKDLAGLGHGAAPQNRDDITESFIKAIGVGRNVLAVKFTNNGGKGVCDIGIRVKLAKKPVISKADSDDSWAWVIPVEAQANSRVNNAITWWRMTDAKPPTHWLFRNQCPGWQDWPEVTRCVIDRENTCRWLRAAVEWKGDPQKVEKAELVYLVDDSATVWIGGVEAAKVGLALQKYASKDITAVFKSTIGKGEWVAVCVEVRNSKGSGYGDFGIRVKMRK